MGTFLLVCIGIVILLAFAIIVNDKNNKKKYGTADVVYLDCVGGVKRLAGSRNCVLIIKETELLIDFPQFMQLDILFNKIKNVYVNTETQIKENVTLTRMLAFGVFSLGMKKKEEEEKMFLIIEYTDEENELQKIIFTGDIAFLNQRLLDKIYDGIDRVKA